MRRTAILSLLILVSSASIFAQSLEYLRVRIHNAFSDRQGNVVIIFDGGTSRQFKSDNPEFFGMNLIFVGKKNSEGAVERLFQLDAQSPFADVPALLNVIRPFRDPANPFRKTNLFALRDKALVIQNSDHTRRLEPMPLEQYSILEGGIYSGEITLVPFDQGWRVDAYLTGERGLKVLLEFQTELHQWRISIKESNSRPWVQYSAEQMSDEMRRRGRFQTQIVSDRQFQFQQGEELVILKVPNPEHQDSDASLVYDTNVPDTFPRTVALKQFKKDTPTFKKLNLSKVPGHDKKLPFKIPTSKWGANCYEILRRVK